MRGILRIAKVTKQSKIKKVNKGREKSIDFITKYRNIKYPRLELKSGKLEAIMPFGKDPKGILEKYRNWIQKKQEFILDCLETARHLKLIDRSREDFEAFIIKSIKHYTEDLGVKINKIFFRPMHTKWASCSAKHNLTINIIMQYLPEKLVEYVLYHEMIHFFERKHNEHFCKLISNKFRNYQEFEKQLFSYWFLLNRKKKRKNPMK